MCFLLATLLVLVVCAANGNQGDISNTRHFMMYENTLDSLTRYEPNQKFKRTTGCRWSQLTHRLDCKLMNIAAMGGLKKVARKSAKILDLRLCRINDTGTLLEGLKFMPFLSQIYLDYNLIRIVSERLFWNNRRLRVISLHGNRISSLHEQTFLRNPKLDMLRLSQNQITTLPPKIFFRSRRLKTLELWENNVQILPPLLFRNNRYLEYVSLSWNKIKNLPPTLFQRNEHLKTVKLFNNNLWCMPSRLFEKNYQLRKINLGYNQLNSLPASIFWHNSRLEDLRIWYNQMNCLPTGVFDFNKRLNYVNLIGQKQSSRNAQLKYMQRTFRGQDVDKLRKALDRPHQDWCDDNRQYGLCKWDSEKKIFSCESALLASLEAIPLPCDVLHLNLANNRLDDSRKLEVAFQSLPDLITVTLSENNLKSTLGDLFYGLRQLEKIDVSLNDIVVLPWNTFQKCPRLKEVDLSRNGLTEIHHDIFALARNLRKINLGQNRCRYLAPDLFKRNTLLRELYLNNNEIIGLPDSIFATSANLVKLDMSFNQLEYISPLLLEGNWRLQELNLRENRLMELEEDLFQNLLWLNTLDLSNNYIEFLPNGIFKENENLRRVYLNGNQLYKLNHNLFDNNPALNHVSLDGNLLAGIPEQMFRNNQNLEALGLQHNCISFLPQNLFENKPRLREVSLRGNPTLPREVRRVFEGDQEVRGLRKKLKQLIVEKEPTTSPSPTTEHVNRTSDEEHNEQAGRKRGRPNGEQSSIEGQFVGFIPVEKLRDIPQNGKNSVEELAPVGGEVIEFRTPLQPRNGFNNSERVERRSVVKPSRQKLVKKHDFAVSRDFVKIKENVEEEGLEAVCMRVWKKNGLVGNKSD